MKHCCLIGGGGFIGKHVARVLLDAGRRVTIVDRVGMDEDDVGPEVCIEIGDCGDKDFTAGRLKGVDEVVYLAYSTVPKTSYEDPVRDIVANLPMAVNVLEAAETANVERIIVFSSGGTVYGCAEKLPISEAHPTRPLCPYGITKLALEKYCWMFHHLRNLPVIVLRPANAFGEGQKPFSGQGLIATAMASAVNGRKVSIYGDAESVRDYLYVEDVARGVLAALDAGHPGACYNMGSGMGRSNRDVMLAIEALVRADGFELRWEVFPRREYDVPVNVLDSRRFTADTRWKAGVSFPEGLQRTWRWIQAHAGIFGAGSPS